MMKQILIFIFLCFSLKFYAKHLITGKVVDGANLPIIGANAYLNGTYDGTSTDDKGEFSFTTSENGEQTLVVSFLSFETYTKKASIENFKNFLVKLKDDVNTLDAVVINAGTFEAGEKAKVTVLKPLDIVTTASALGDFLGAIQTLPGTSTVAEDGRLFVRGGEANETQIFIDGARVFTPYTPTANNIPTRGRYSPFLFKGISFSTGGYSAEYGQALSSILSLNTIDKPDQEKTEISLMTVGAGVGNTQIWGKNSFSINTSYINLAPYLAIYPDRNSWNKPYQAANGELIYRHSFKDDSMLKMYGAFSYTDFNLIQKDINFPNGYEFGLQNKNLYFNSSYKNKLTNNWKYETAVSFTHDANNLLIEGDLVTTTENSAHIKFKLRKQFTTRFILYLGSELFNTDFDESYTELTKNAIVYGFTNQIFASFAETDIYFSKYIAAKIGVRAEGSKLFKDWTISPRISVSYKASESGQFSFAFGNFYQNPANNYVKFEQNLTSEKATHLIANYQWSKQNEIFRVEAYHKNYKNLISFDTPSATFNSNFSNNGFGYAQGIDIFWRQNQVLKNTDYWVSYSFLDTKRNYQNFPKSATPNFANTHNFSIVGKHFIESWKSQLGFAYNFATGRPYTNPNTHDFLGEKSPNYNSLSINWAYLIDQQKILYFSVNNALGTKNILGYRYKNTPDSTGFYERENILPNADSFFFIGFFWTISDDKKANNLNNL